MTSVGDAIQLRRGIAIRRHRSVTGLIRARCTCPVHSPGSERSRMPHSRSRTHVSDQPRSNEFSDRLHADLLDSLDEELEIALDEDRLGPALGRDAGAPTDLERKVYFRELFRLQAELVKLQDWVVHAGLKVVVLFEGRDAAGKGGIIKRVTQRLNPRVCRVAALPAPNDRERTQWYFQRYASHLP